MPSSDTGSPRASGRRCSAHRERHEGKGSGFGYGIAERGEVTRTLSARYYKDGARDPAADARRGAGRAA